MRPDSIRGRLTLWFVAALALPLALIESMLYLDYRRSLVRDAEVRLREAAQVVSRGLTGEPDDLRENLGIVGASYGADGLGVAVFDSGGRLVARTPTGPRLAAPPAHDAATEFTLDGKSMIYRLPTGGRTLESGISWESNGRNLAHLADLLVVLFGSILLFAALGGWWLVGAALRPIDAIARAADRLSADRLAERLPETAPDREIVGLTKTLNRMIGRLASVFESQRRFTADASHELRTPITIVQNEVEVALSRPRTGEEYRQSLAGVLEEVHRMARLVNDLLFLARGDGPAALDRVHVSLAELCRWVAEEYRCAAESKGLDLRVGPLAEDVAVLGDPDRLRVLLENLVDNAIKYARAPGAVRISVEGGPRFAEISVADTGPGIGADHLPHLFDRFYRIDKSRSRALGGSGLGLSICRSIALQHGGDVRVESPPGAGARFTVSLPRAPTPAANERSNAGARLIPQESSSRKETS